VLNLNLIQEKLILKLFENEKIEAHSNNALREIEREIDR